MKSIAFTALLILTTLMASGQSRDPELLERFKKCDTTLAEFEVMELIFSYRNPAKPNENEGLLEEMIKLEGDSLFEEMESRCSGILAENPINLCASYFYTTALLGQKKRESLQAYWNKTQMIYNAVSILGRGTESSPYYISDLNDAKAMIYIFMEADTKVDSISHDGEGMYSLTVSKGNGSKEVQVFDFSEKTSIREVFFDYHRDFNYYLSESAKPESRYNYDALLKRFQQEDRTLKKHEIVALMIGFTKKPDYRPYKHVGTEREIMKLVDGKDYKKALTMCEELLKTNPVNFTALMEEGFSLWKIKSDKSHYPSAQSRMVVDAVLWSGDGSYKHPYFVLSPIDGQTIITYIFGGSIGTMGSGNDPHGYFLDMLEMKKTGLESRMLHFNIEHATGDMFKRN